jgi:hypothetical protein
MSFEEYVKNKSIAIIGPAPSAFEHNTEASIDSYDLVMRFNTAVPVRPECVPHTGKKTNILCNCLEHHPISGGVIDPNIWINEKVEWVLSPYPRGIWFAKPNIDRFVILNKNRLNLTCFDANQYNTLEKTLGTRPNSGILGILHLLNYDIEKIYITGMTFGRGGYHPGYKDGITAEQYNKLANGPYHTQKPQEDYFKALYKKDSRITVDPTLENILK